MTQIESAYHAEAYDSDPRATSPSRGRQSGSPRRSLAAAAALIFILSVAAITYVVSDGLTPSYSSTSELSINVAGSSGLGEDSVLASNDLTAQYVQLFSASSVLVAPAQTLGLSVATLQDKVSAGSVAQQNLLQITAHSSHAQAAQRIAQIVTRDFLSYIWRTNRQSSANYTRTLSMQLQQVNVRIAALTKQLRASATSVKTGNATASLTSLYGALLAQQQTLRGDIAEHAAASIISLKTVVPARAATQVAPKPKLYTLIAALVAMFICLQLAVLGDRRRRTRRI